eukprot:scaffold7688_cov130-Isochrysis_galbana.AAC.7
MTSSSSPGEPPLRTWSGVTELPSGRSTGWPAHSRPRSGPLGTPSALAAAASNFGGSAGICSSQHMHTGSKSSPSAAAAPEASSTRCRLLDSFSEAAVPWHEVAAALETAAAEAPLGSKAAEPSRMGVAAIPLSFRLVA